MNLERTSLSTAFHFNEFDLTASLRGVYSDKQRDIIVMLGKITCTRRSPNTSSFPSRTTTQSLPQIHTATGRIHVINETRFVRGLGSSAGLRVETFHLIVHGETQDVDFPVSQDALMVFEPVREYTVYYYLNNQTPTLLSVHTAD